MYGSMSTYELSHFSQLLQRQFKDKQVQYGDYYYALWESKLICKSKEILKTGIKLETKVASDEHKPNTDKLINYE